MKKEPIFIYRKKIDRLDKRIARLLSSRFETAKRIGTYKKSAGLPVTDKNREAIVLASLEANGGIYGENVKEVYKTVLGESKKLQEGEK